MAEEKGVVLQAYHLRQLNRGLSNAMTPRTMADQQEGPLFKQLWNFVYLRGSLGPHFGVKKILEFSNNGYPTIEQNGTYFETTPNGLKNGQTPTFIFADYPRTFNNSSSTVQTDYGTPMMVLVTSREIFVYSPQDSTWYNATPVYTTPAITVDVNGTTGVVTTTAAADAKWDQYKIVPGQLIEFNADGNWYTIESVDSNTQLTTNYTGANLTADPYIIRRCFGGRNYSHGDILMYATVFNGSLYLAGRTLAGAGVGPAVIKVSDLYDNVFTTDYILAGFELTGDMDAAGQVVDDLWDIMGLQVLQDGRVVIACAEVPTGGTGIVSNRIRYSSNDEAYQWVASPAGFIDVVGTPGGINALGSLDPNTLTVHFDRGIHIAAVTGQDDPPLAVSKSAAEVGCFSPKTLVQHRGGELFVGADGTVRRFDGATLERLTDQSFWLLAGTADWSDRYSFGTVGSRNVAALSANMLGLYDPSHNHYRVFVNTTNFEGLTTVPASYEDYEQECYCYVLDLGTGALFRDHFLPQVTAASNPMYGFGVESNYNSGLDAGDFGSAAIGIPTCLPNGDQTSPGQAEQPILYSLSAEVSIDQNDTAPYGSRFWVGTLASMTNEADPSGFVTDDFDFGYPGIDKTLSHVLIWASVSDDVGPTNTSTLTLEASGDGGSSWMSGTYSVPTPTSDGPIMYSFSPQASEKWRFRLKKSLPLGRTAQTPFAITRLSIYYQTQGEIEAVDPDITP